PNITEKIAKDEREKQAGCRYDNVLNKARRSKAQPAWIDSPTWEKWMANWSTPDFQAKSSKQKANR
ncbi:hypothetical protein J0J30_23265, partial [Vibrio vulnificus]|nr:hypothetical protein [Vibrio vulnificus]